MTTEEEHGPPLGLAEYMQPGGAETQQPGQLTDKMRMSDGELSVSDAVGFEREEFDGKQQHHDSPTNMVEEKDEKEDEEEEEDIEEEEEDDDQVRQSWATEREEHGQHEDDEEHFRFRAERDHHDEDKNDEGAFDDDDDESFGSLEWSFGSLEWVTRQLRRLEMRRQEALASPRSDGTTAELKSEDDVDKSVRDAMRLLDTDDAESDSPEREAEAQPYYFDLVAEAMGMQWRHDHANEHSFRELTPVEKKKQVHPEQEDEAEEEEEEEEEEKKEEKDVRASDDETQEDQAQAMNQEDDEWLEAYTAKGRVYYYNRRTRESSWTRPVALASEDDSSARREVSPTAVSVKSAASPSNEHQEDVLYCCFCGTALPGARGFRLHMQECSTLLRHKRSSSALYSQFQETLTILSEDATLRSMHYASSFPDAVPHSFDAPTPQSVRQSLSLLRRQRRPSTTVPRHRTHDDEIPSFQPTGFTTPATSRRTSGPRPQASSSAVRSRPKASQSAFSAPQPSAMETCRHCGRSFAEGRLAKHEAVCPRVFGNETAWGRGAGPGRTSTTEQHQQILRSLQRRRAPQLSSKVQQHNLSLTFREHQASLVECPCCRRKFAPSGAKEHIEICRTVQHRPRNPVPLLKDFATAS
ncbi:hypothetical protein P43SY_009500 [Pythium insidiosum]|uniref:WW domain-containing protein n=1 Tax=Pythium insidiosum TaxID=114742 RepID=A0AAD5QAD2_PYTIN|nr:hypothetical protein P43SY_009500 [Pythium insidiosum]